MDLREKVIATLAVADATSLSSLERADRAIAAVFDWLEDYAGSNMASFAGEAPSTFIAAARKEAEK